MDPIVEIKSRIDIVELMSGYVEVKKAGKNYKACCPFHGEKTPSFVISPERGFAYCFGCQQHGDVIRMVELLEGVDFREAVKILADKAGVELGADFGGGVKKEKKDRLLDINERAAEFFADELKKNDAAKAYLAKRGLMPETIKEWQIGYAPDGFEILWPKLESAGFEKNDLIEAGVAGVKEMGSSRLFDKFRHRVMFPIRDARGRVVAFTGRVLDASEPKYMNSSESPIFQKGAVLFGFDRAKETIRETKTAVVVEGQMDVVSCHAAGFTNVVASSGTALTEMHLTQIKHVADTIILSMDADRAGVEATKRAIDLAHAADLNVKIARLPADCKDPDETIKKDRALFVAALDTARSVFEFYFTVVFAEANLADSSTKKTIAREMLAVARHFASAIEREEFVKALALRLGVSESALYEEASRLPREPTTKPTSSPDASIEPETFDREDLIVGLLLAFPKLDEAAAGFTPKKTTNQLIIAARGDLESLADAAKLHAKKLELYASDTYATFSESKLESEIKTLVEAAAGKSREVTLRELKAKIDAAEQAGDDDLAGRLFGEYQSMLKA